jgi:hydrogenase nickel incorporation protein HypB
MNTTRVITVRRDVQAAVHGRAEEFRRAMTERGTLIVNVLSSPGSGKTSLLAATADALPPDFRSAVLVGDIATDRDAQRLAEHVPAVQLTTGGACHLEYPLIEQGWRALGEPEVEFLFLENIGNLVCPASHDLGEHLRVLLLSATEGDDKPAKYPKAFRTSHALIVSKSDLLPYVPFSVERAVADARAIQPDLAVFTMSAHPPAGFDAWCEYLIHERRRMLAGEECRPNR